MEETTVVNLWCHRGNRNFQTDVGARAGPTTRYEEHWECSRISLPLPKRGTSLETVPCPECGGQVTFRIESLSAAVLRSALTGVPVGLFASIVGFGLVALTGWRMHLATLGCVAFGLIGFAYLLSPIWVGRTQRHGPLKITDNKLGPRQEPHRLDTPPGIVVR